MNSLESQVVRLIGENPDSPDVFTDTADGLEPIRDSLNDAIEELCMVTGMYRRRYLLATHEDRALYRLEAQNDDICWPVGAWRRDTNRQLTQGDVWALAASDPWFLKRGGDPEVYYPLGLKYLGLYPRPGTKGIILELDCIAVPKPYQHGRQPIRIKDYWERAAVQRALSDFYAGRGDAKRAAEYLTQYLETAQIMTLHPERSEQQYQYGGFQRNKWSGQKALKD